MLHRSSPGCRGATSRVTCQGERGTDSPRPVFVDEDRVEDAVHQGPVPEGSLGPCPSADLSEPSFAGAGGPDLPSPGKGPAAEAGEQTVGIVAQGSDGPGADVLPAVGEAAGRQPSPRSGPSACISFTTSNARGRLPVVAACRGIGVLLLCRCCFTTGRTPLPTDT